MSPEKESLSGSAEAGQDSNPPLEPLLKSAPPTPKDEPEGESGRAGGIIALGALLLLAFSLCWFKVHNADFFWHLKAGEWIFQHHRPPRADMFSFSREGAPWLDAQWLFQVFIYGFYRLLGEKGPTIFREVVVIFTTLLLVFAVPGKAVPLPLRAFGGFLFLLALNPRLMVRPEILTCLYMSAFFFALERAWSGGTKWLALCPLLQLLFVNSHGLWPIGLALIGAFGLDRLLQLRRERSGWRELWPWALCLAVSFLACFLQPYGIKGLLFPVVLFKEAVFSGSLHRKFVAELYPVFSRPDWLLMFSPFLALSLVSLAAGVKSLRRERPFLLLLGLWFFYLGASASRNTSVASAALAIVLFASLPGLFGSLSPAIKARVSRISLVLTVGGSLLVSWLCLSSPIRTWDLSGRQRGAGFDERSPYYPVRATRFLKNLGYKGNLMNSMNFGGYLIFHGYPDWKVFADARLEIGGAKAIEYYQKAYTYLRYWNAVARRNHARAAVISYHPPYQYVMKMLYDSPDWALVFLDSKAAVFLKRGAGFDDVIARKEITGLHFSEE